jgi:hypothetical protein
VGEETSAHCVQKLVDSESFFFFFFFFGIFQLPVEFFPFFYARRVQYMLAGRRCVKAEVLG